MNFIFCYRHGVSWQEYHQTETPLSSLTERTWNVCFGTEDVIPLLHGICGLVGSLGTYSNNILLPWNCVIASKAETSSISTSTNCWWTINCKISSSFSFSASYFCLPRGHSAHHDEMLPWKTPPHYLSLSTVPPAIELPLKQNYTAGTFHISTCKVKHPSGPG